MLSRKYQKFTIDTVIQQDFEKKLLYWGQKFDFFTFLTPNNIPYLYEPFKKIAAIDAYKKFPIQENVFEKLKEIYKKEQDWLFGYLTYDIKNELENLISKNENKLQFVPAYFYIPKHLIIWEGESIVIHSTEEPEAIFQKIIHAICPPDNNQQLNLKTKVDATNYLENVHKIQKHIIEGDVYELNYCIEFFAEQKLKDPVNIYLQLCKDSPMPFSAFQKIKNQYILSASPERFLKKEGQKLISQPIKGTAPRGKTPDEDNLLKETLKNSEKEQAENMMIVDLVRNDLTKSAQTGSIKVEEIFKVYTFQQLHQMISTITAHLAPSVSVIDAIKNTFPMGSMTGAPKIKAMELIDKYENSYRGPYAGTLGYITPTGNFDFNVLIRSIFYNEALPYISFQVGSALTYDAIPEKEYEECMLKAKVIIKILTQI